MHELVALSGTFRKYPISPVCILCVQWAAVIAVGLNDLDGDF